MKIENSILAAIISFVCLPAWADTELRDVPGSFSIATRMANECIFEEGLERPSTLLSEPIALVQSKPSVEKSLSAEHGAALAIKLIDFGFSKLDTYIDNASKDKVASYSRRHPITLHQMDKVEGGYAVKLNPDLGCLTIVAHTSPITYTGKPHSGADQAQLASYTCGRCCKGRIASATA